ncbi:uncharacterized protein LOC143207225 [Lasioglossum baleicum]|uniref:uncharacterized protein LOC143207225 n=1 Tax=Lasioglossum baleicum TaxID=434251 RepID=UPI003FCDA54B
MAKREIITSNSLATDNDYKKDVDLSIKWNRYILKPMGVWPRSRHVSQLELCFNWLINAVCYSLISFLFAPCYLYVSLEVEEVYDKLKLYGPLMFCVMACVKYYSLMAHTNDIRECIKCIEWDWGNVNHSEDRGIMVANAIFGRRLVKICTFFMFSGFVFYYIAIPISVGTIAIEGANRTFIPLAFPVSKLIVDTQRNPSNQIFFSIQFFGGMLIHAIAAGACCLAVAFAVHAYGQMQVLMCWMSHLVDGRVDMSNTTNGRIAKIVNQHVRIQKYVNIVVFTPLLCVVVNFDLVYVKIATELEACVVHASRFKMLRTIEQRSAIKVCVKLNKSATDTFDMIRAAYKGEAMVGVYGDSVQVATSRWRIGVDEGSVQEATFRHGLGVDGDSVQEATSRHRSGVVGDSVQEATSRRVNGVLEESRAKDMTAIITYATILASLIFNIFIFCYIGELVAEQYRKVGQMSYMIDWYRLPKNTKLGVVLIMAMSSTPTKLTAGRLVKLSLASFSDVMKTSVAFLNMLRRLTDTRE